MRRGGGDVGILFVLVSESGSSVDSAFCVLVPARLYLKNGNYPVIQGASPLPQLFLNPLVLFVSCAREFITKQEQSEALRGSGCSGSDF